MSEPDGPAPSYEELAALVVGLVARVETLDAENAELRRRLGMNSTNSSTPPSKDSIGARAKRRADRSSRERSKDRKPGGQHGRKGSGLMPAAEPDRTESVDPAAQCRGCGDDLIESHDAGTCWAQVWDILPVAVEKVHYLLPRRRCGRCGTTTTAAVPYAQAGAVVYGPHINAAAVLLAYQGNVPIERTALVMEALLGVPVSSGFVARALARLAERLQRASFDEAMTAALRAEDVLCGDETPTNVIGRDLDETTGQPVAGAPHAITLRTPDARLIWYAAMGSRSKTAISNLGVLEGYTGYLVRDDYAGWHQFDPHLAGVQQCAAHLIRHCKGVLELHPTQQKWAGEVVTVLREANTAVEQAKTQDHDHLDPQLLADLRAVTTTRSDGESSPTGTATGTRATTPATPSPAASKPKPTKSGYSPATSRFPGQTTPVSKALKGPKRHQAVSGYWHTLTTLAGYCRVSSYLVSARGHGVRAIDAIHAALNGNPWLPAPANA